MQTPYKHSDTLTGHSQCAQKGVVTPAHIVHNINFFHLFFQEIGHCLHAPSHVHIPHISAATWDIRRLSSVTRLQSSSRADLGLGH